MIKDPNKDVQCSGAMENQPQRIFSDIPVCRCNPIAKTDQFFHKPFVSLILVSRSNTHIPSKGPCRLAYPLPSPAKGCAGIPPPVRPKTVPIMSFLKKLLDTTIYLYISISIYVNLDLLCSELPLSKFSHQVITFYSQPDHEMGLPHEEPMYVRIPTGIPKDVV